MYYWYNPFTVDMTMQPPYGRRRRQPRRPPFDMPPFGMPPFTPDVSPIDGPPTSPPPSFTPELSPYRVDPGSIRQCRRKYTYIWLENGDSFWFYPTFVGRTSIAGYRWIGFWWIYYGTDLDNIRSFICY